MRIWTDLRQLPVHAWFRWKQERENPFFCRINYIRIEQGEPVIFLTDKQGPCTLLGLAQAWVYSYNLKDWQPCGLPTECPECGYENLGYCIPEPEAPDGWFCTRCKAPHVEGMKKYADPYTRAKMGVSNPVKKLREDGSGSPGGEGAAGR